MKKFLSLAILAALAASFVVGCGSSSDAGEDKTATSKPAPGPDKVQPGPAAASAQN